MMQQIQSRRPGNLFLKCKRCGWVHRAYLTPDSDGHCFQGCETTAGEMIPLLELVGVPANTRPQWIGVIEPTLRHLRSLVGAY
jgi:hypothetical protein